MVSLRQLRNKRTMLRSHRKYLAVVVFAGVIAIAISLKTLSFYSYGTREPESHLKGNGRRLFASASTRDTSETAHTETMPSDAIPSFLNHLSLPTESLRRTIRVFGYQFNATGTSRHVEAELTTSFIHNFSPVIEDEAHRRFLDPNNFARYCVLSPAMVISEDTLLVAFRIYHCQQKAVFRFRVQVNHLYLQPYDSQLRAVKGQGRFIGMIYPQAKSAPWPHLYGDRAFKRFDGPEDPRAVRFMGNTYIQFQSVIYPNNTWHMYTFLWNVDKEYPIVPRVEGNIRTNARSHSTRQDKNWMPLTVNGRLFFIQNLDPLLMISCGTEGQCEYVETSDKNTNTSGKLSGVFEGGTPFVLYQWPYFIGLISCKYSRRFGNSSIEAYTVNLIVLHVEPFRIMYISEDIPLHDHVFLNQLRPAHVPILNNFYQPSSLVLESTDSVIVGATINEQSSFILRIRGLQQLLDNVIINDISEKPIRGPPKRHVRRIMVNYLNRTFTPLAKSVEPWL